MTNPLNSLGLAARLAATELASASTVQKDSALTLMASGLLEKKEEILAANQIDVAAARQSGMAEALIDRMILDDARLNGIVESVKNIRSLPNPIDRLIGEVTRPNGLRIEKRAVPLGVIGIIFEARPNVAVDAAALCLKSGNACILRGGKDSWQTVQIFVAIIQEALTNAGLSRFAVQTVPSADRELVGALLKLDQYVDVIIPRGGKSLISRVREESRIPVFSHLEGICHVYIDAKADRSKAIAITMNAKMRRVSVCGAAECLILHKSIVPTIGRDVISSLIKAGCEVRVPGELLSLNTSLKTALDSDYGHEFLAPIIAVATVDSAEQAIKFINCHGSQHTEAIITEDQATADNFMRHVNSAIALHNASTQFADGGEFGKGAEIGIATGKLHARGPVGLEELTTYQYRVFGNGQTRP